MGENEVDMETLLRKYIAYVLDCEGVDFIWYGGGLSDVKFSDDEWAALVRLAEEGGETGPDAWLLKVRDPKGILAPRIYYERHEDDMAARRMAEIKTLCEDEVYVTLHPVYFGPAVEPGGGGRDAE